jgi:tRNA dimethylallyltransferase
VGRHLRRPPPPAARAPLDAQRIQRALEVWQVSGRPLSSFHSGRFGMDGKAAEPSARARSTPLFSLEPADRAWLHARIAQRFDAMLNVGFLAEMQRLRERGDLHAELPSMRCVGYRQAWELLDDASPQLLPLLRERGIAATRQLAKRQLTWLRSMPARQVITADDPQAEARFVEAAWTHIEAARG